ncbi:MAG: hypothetical protein NT126_10735 [Bacteroidetes bacterium]|nr:hypothetical protein [Bacteroidota bacterium]
MKKHLKILAILFVTCTKVSLAQSTISTMSDLNNFFEMVEFNVMLQTDVQKGEALQITSKKFFIPLSNYIDLNVIGKGKSLVLNPDKMSSFIVSQLDSVSTSELLGHKLLDAFIDNKFSEEANKSVPGKDKPKVTLGGYFATEFEYHQEPDGIFHPLLEINQSRIYVAADINPSETQSVISFLGEWNPIPEEVIHQVDEISFLKDTTHYVLSNQAMQSGTMHMEAGELIPFERLYVRINNVAGSRINVVAGQFRNPFGFWSDYTSHRNFTSTKNNQLVNGFALKKIDLGVKIEGQIQGGLEWAAAIMQGRLSRTTPLSREDNDDKKDFCGHIRYNHKKFSVGASAYFAEFNTRRIALGLDFQVNFRKLTVSGESVYQRNSNPAGIFMNADGLNELRSLSSYLQLDLELTPKFHLYGMYELWDFTVDKKLVAPNPEAKVFHGLRYIVNSSMRWIIIEYGHMFHEGYDKGFTHLSSQLDLTF